MAYFFKHGDETVFGPKAERGIRDGRLNADSNIATENSRDWRRLGEFPEFAKELKPAAPPPAAPPLEPKEPQPKSWESELSLPVLVLVWFIKIVFVWPIYFPCWLAYKVVYVAIPAGLALWVAGALMDNESLSNVGAMAVCGVGPLGLTIRFYVWAFNLRNGDD
jgi:hypothetical protein